MKRRLATVSIVGRPNVGKSTLFNRLLGRRKAIVLDTPGVTRDRNYDVADINDALVMLVDTGGFLRDAPDELTKAVAQQVEFAVAESDGMIFMVDGRAGLLPQDEEIAEYLRPMAASVVLAVNKIDMLGQESLAAEFYSLGFERVLSISAEHKLGIGATGALATPINTSSQTSGFVTGWTTGFGVEFMWGQHLSFKGEYLYVDFGNINSAITYTYPGNTSSLSGVVKDRDNVVRVGVNYRF